MADHGVLAIRRHNSNGGVRLANSNLTRAIHCTGMKGGDLVVIQIGCNEGLRAETILGSQHLRSLNAKPAKPFKILGTISANGSEEAAVLAKAP